MPDGRRRVMISSPFLWKLRSSIIVECVLCCFVGCTPSAGLSGPECCRMEELSSKIRHERIQNFSSQLHSAIVYNSFL